MTVAESVIRADLAGAIGEPVLDLQPIPEGHSGFTYWVELSGRRAVLRLPPPGARIAGPADIPRQGRIMQALHARGLPVPEIIAMSTEPVVDGRPYVLMEALPGERIEAAAARGSDPLELARTAIEVLHQLQATPPEHSGIGSEAPVPLQGELDRWSWLMERAPAELTGDASELARRLASAVPQETRPVVVHGDYHFGNMLFAGGRVSAVLDWEIAELGHPLLDLCCLCVVFQGGSDGEARGWGASRDLEPDALRDLFGADAAEFRWTLGLTYYKYAAILGYNLMLHRRGKRRDPSYEGRTGTIVGFIQRGLRLLA
ncbi:MAG: phosphotransferase family protein [Chloroflexi bacterium]|nr:MAG: phosphotransferase family protein [Chloroflexota bacterium]